MNKSTGEHSGKRVDPSLDTTGSGFVAANVEKFWSRPDRYTSDAYRLFMVTSEGVDGEHVVRTVYATSEDDARQAHQENYADETVLAVQE
jgi:hypothetical protein